jgi:hypothetical protein
MRKEIKKFPTKVDFICNMSPCRLVGKDNKYQLSAEISICGGRQFETNSRWRKEMVNTAGIIDDLIREVPPVGTYLYPDLLPAVRKKQFHGVGISGGGGSKTYLLFIGGEPEGAVIADEKGELYGNKAVYLIKGSERFTLFPLSPPVVERLVFGCRIYDKSHFKAGYSLGLTEIGKKAEGIGRLVIAVKSDGSPASGITIKIRREGQIVGSDVTDREGLVSFRLLYGTYDLLVVREENNIDVYGFSFSPELQEEPVELDIG